MHRLKHEDQSGTHFYACTFNCCSRTITLKDNAIIKVNGENHKHDPKFSKNVQFVLVGLKRRVFSDIEKPIPGIYDEEI